MQAGAAKRTESRWVVREHAQGVAETLAGAMGLAPVASRVLAGRGLESTDQVHRFLNPQLADLHDPLRMRDMDRAAARIEAAIEKQEKILLYGDYDVDGTSSVVLLLKTFALLGGRGEFHVPHRLRDGYGMRAEVIEKAATDGVALIISVDTGIRAGEVVRQARELGIDVIVTDHHLPEAELPPALAVLNPNRLDCDYPEKNLCGAAVAFKLAQALIERTSWSRERKTAILESLLKLVAIATVADVVPLVGENRVIVSHGLAGLNEVRNIGLRALLKVAGFAKGEAPTAGQVAFRLAPRINAAGRMDTASDVIRLFETNDPQEASDLAQKLHELNAARQLAEAETLEACLAEPVEDARYALVFAGEGWHKGVVGIVASRLVERHSRPVFVLSIHPETGEVSGSGRSITAFHLLDALETMGELFTKFGGHAHAAGVTLPRERLEDFRARFNLVALEKLTANDLRPTVTIDAWADAGELNDESAAQLLALAPFGNSNPAPVIAMQSAELAAEPQVMKEKHLRLRFRQKGRLLTMKAWNAAERAGELVPGRRYDVAFTVEDDAFSAARGYAPWSATLKDFRPSEG